MKNRSKIITETLTHIPIFDKRYRKRIIPLFDEKPGVYALYDKRNELYYVGKASNSIMTRVRNHSRSLRHSNKWTHFDVYFTAEKNLDHIEALIIHIAIPKGNKQRNFRSLTKAKDLGNDIKKIRKEVDKERDKRFSKIGKRKRFTSKKKRALKPETLNQTQKKALVSLPQSSKRPSLKNYFKRNQLLIAKYKNKEHKALLLKDTGKIIYKNKFYNTPSAVAKAIQNHAGNGWDFLKIRDSKNNWVKLGDLVKKVA